MPGKYASKRDELLHTLANEGWTDETTGNVAAPCGFVSRLHLTGHDLGRAYLEKVENIDGVPQTELLGDWTLVEDAQGFVSARKHEDEAGACATFQVAELRYSLYAGVEA